MSRCNHYNGTELSGSWHAGTIWEVWECIHDQRSILPALMRALRRTSIVHKPNPQHNPFSPPTVCFAPGASYWVLSLSSGSWLRLFALLLAASYTCRILLLENLTTSCVIEVSTSLLLIKSCMQDTFYATASLRTKFCRTNFSSPQALQQFSDWPVCKMLAHGQGQPPM